MYRVLFYLFFILLLIGQSCKEKENILSLKQMSGVLLDMHLAESYAQQIPGNKGADLKNQDSLLRFNADILRKHRVTEAQFKTSINWYKQRPDLLDSIYQSILSEYIIMQAKVNK